MLQKENIDIANRVCACCCYLCSMKYGAMLRREFFIPKLDGFLILQAMIFDIVLVNF
jgi:hypothetical protein